MDSKKLLEFFDSMTSKMRATMKDKNHDYSSGESAFKNFKMVEDYGITSTEKGIFIRMLDKIARLSTGLSSSLKVSDESLNDTLQDLANYSILLAAYLESKKQGLPRGGALVHPKTILRSQIPAKYLDAITKEEERLKKKAIEDKRLKDVCTLSQDNKNRDATLKWIAFNRDRR